MTLPGILFGSLGLLAIGVVAFFGFDHRLRQFRWFGERDD